MRRLIAFGFLSNLFIVGFVLMGFEMLGSRYLNPYFGGGITTWACLISVVLVAMMLGYLGGGFLVDRFPGLKLLASLVFTSGIALGIIAWGANSFIVSVVEFAGDGFQGTLIAALGITLVPVACLSACSPYTVRLLLTELEFGGRVTGLVYSVSTFGNVAGTLVTTFWLIPWIGSKSITQLFAVVAFGLSAVIFCFVWARRGRNVFVFLLAVTCPHLPFSSDGRALSGPPPDVSLTASYPEGPLWLSHQLLFADMRADAVYAWTPEKTRQFWTHRGCGPTAITRFGNKKLAVNCHLSGSIAILDRHGKLLAILKAGKDNTPNLRNPNDINHDGAGGVFFSDPGPFSTQAPPTGRVYHLSKQGRFSAIASGLKYPNGVAFSDKSSTLYVAEHLAKRVLSFRLDRNGSIVNSFVAVPRSVLFPASFGEGEQLAGPDGIRIDDEGNLYIALYGAGIVHVVRSSGQHHRVKVPMKYVTSIAIFKGRLAIVGTKLPDGRPGSGRVIITTKAKFLQSTRIGF